MKKIISFIFIGFVTTILFLSCEKDDNADDNTPPSITDVKIGSLNDTIINDKNILRFNRGENRLIDTILIGTRIQFSARFQDNHALSTYHIKMRIDSGGLKRNEMGFGITDTCIDVSRSWVTIFGYKDTTIIKQNDIIIPDSISKVRQNESKYLQLREGEYFFELKCIDQAGNETYYHNPITNQTQKVYMMTRKRMIEVLTK